MSETYRIELRESVSCRISAEDRSVLEIELVPLLPIEDMLELLRHALSARGYEAHGDHQLRRTGDQGEETIVDLDTKARRLRPEVSPPRVSKIWLKARPVQSRCTRWFPYSQNWLKMMFVGS